MTTATYNFIINCTDAELAEYAQKNVDTDIRVFSRWDLEWCLQTYLILKARKRLNVLLSNRIIPGAINIVHSAQLLPLKGTASDFIVCIRADFPKRRWAHYHIVQNQNQAGSDTSVVPFWVQPGLVKRNQDRKGVQRVAYAGQTFNGNLAGSEQTWQQMFQQHGLEFVTLPSGDCNDLSSIDVLIGIRSFDTQPHNTKPPSKLVNAWHAQIPFIGGYDSAFQQVGEPGKDYLLVKTPQETIDAVLKLRNDEQLYTTLVQNGLRKAPKFTTETIAELWEQILTGPVQKRYAQWKKNRFLETLRFNALLQLGLLEHRSKQVAKKLMGRK